MKRVRSFEFGVRSLKLAGLLVVAVLLCYTEIVHAAGWQWIDGAQVQTRMKEGSSLWLIDVRGGAAYDMVHIEGSVNIASEALAHKKFPLQKTLILVDDSLGQKAARAAADALLKKGHERVFVLDGGIVAWKIEGRPVAEGRVVVRGVNAGDFKWALAQPVPMKVYDLRDAKEQKLGAIRNAEAVAGKTVAERVEKLKTMLKTGDRSKDLASRMKKPQSVVLVFPASADAEGFTRKVLLTAKADIRYLIGGYEATVSDQTRGIKTAGACPTCPGKGK